MLMRRFVCVVCVIQECDLEFSVVGNYSHTYYFGHERTVKIDFIRTGQHDLEVRSHLI